MDVSIETTGSLSRRFRISIPAADVESQVAARLNKMTRTVRLDGFRPGKVPLSVVRKRFGSRVLREVVAEVVELSYRRALKERGLTPAGGADIDISEVVPGEDIRFTADVELYPEFTPAPLKGVKVEKLVSEVLDADVDETVGRLRLKYADWRPVDRAAQEGDRVRVYFRKKPEVFEADDKGEQTLVLRSVPGIAGEFATQLLKSKPGAVKKIKLNVPEDYPLAGSAGKKLKFKVEVREVAESVLPPLDQDFFKRCGVEEGGLEALKKMFREGMEHELESKLRSSLRSRMLDLLLERNDVEAPETMVRREADKMRKETVARLGSEEDAAKVRDGLFREQALRRVKLGLIMNKIAQANDLSVKKREFEAAVGKAVSIYEDPEAAAQHYRTDPQAYAALAGAILEDKVMQWALEQVQIEEKPCSFKELMLAEAVRERG